MDPGRGLLLLALISPEAEAQRARFFYKESFFGDQSNWWVPTVPCLLQWVECSYFDILSLSAPTALSQREVTQFARDDRGRSVPTKESQGTEKLARYTLTAHAVRRKGYQYVLPDEDLAASDSR